VSENASFHGVWWVLNAFNGGLIGCNGGWPTNGRWFRRALQAWLLVVPQEMGGRLPFPS